MQQKIVLVLLRLAHNMYSVYSIHALQLYSICMYVYFPVVCVYLYGSVCVSFLCLCYSSPFQSELNFEMINEPTQAINDAFYTRP